MMVNDVEADTATVVVERNINSGSVQNSYRDTTELSIRVGGVRKWFQLVTVKKVLNSFETCNDQIIWFYSQQWCSITLYNSIVRVFFFNHHVFSFNYFLIQFFHFVCMHCLNAWMWSRSRIDIAIVCTTLSVLNKTYQSLFCSMWRLRLVSFLFCRLQHQLNRNWKSKEQR